MAQYKEVQTGANTLVISNDQDLVMQSEIEPRQSETDQFGGVQDGFWIVLYHPSVWPRVKYAPANPPEFRESSVCKPVRTDNNKSDTKLLYQCWAALQQFQFANNP